jgi:hypothetical protein
MRPMVRLLGVLCGGAILWMVLIACGIKAPPRPPLAEGPQAVTSSAAEAR